MISQDIFGSEPARGWRPWGVLVPVLALVFTLLSVGSLTLALRAAALLDAKENPVGLTGFAAFLILPFTALALIVFAWVLFVERRPLSTIGLTANRRIRTFVGGILIGVVMTGTIIAAIWAGGGFAVGNLVPAFSSPVALAGIAVLLLCFCVQASAEEILFRGWMMSAVAFKFGVVPAVAVSAGLFTLLHYEPTASWIFAANVFLFGVFAACWALKTGNVWGAMGWHTGWNWFLGVGFQRPVTGLDTHMPALVVHLIPKGADYLTGGAEGAEASVMCTAVLIAGILVVLFRRRRDPGLSDRA